jgi:nondiscriminating glutamyl-tRNA synthetase
MSINTKDLGGDLVIQKHNGQVLYNFAVVVDDHDMSITHVIRGEDHLTNTAKQIAIYEALGFPVPQFGHLPLIFTKDRQKLSKRKHGDIAGIEKYIREGYLPEALNNYLVATSYTSSVDGLQEVYLMKDAIKHFTIEGMSKSPAVYDLQKLNWFNREYIAKLSFDELVSKLKPFLKYDLAKYSLDDQKQMIDSVRGNLNKFDDINDNISYFFEDNICIDPKLSKSLTESKSLLIALLNLVESSNLDWKNPVSLKDAINTLGESLGLNGKHLFLPIRTAISGIAHGPDLGLVMYLLGKDCVSKRIKQVI